MDLLTQQEAASMLGVSVQTIRRFRLSGRLKTVKLSYRTIRIPRLDVEKFMFEGSKCNTTENRQGSAQNQMENTTFITQKAEEAENYHYGQKIWRQRRLVFNAG
tara:strand:+ start:901 stop:1212 length:312 start_codon:yes stop_codon:yes gene_type:complete